MRGSAEGGMGADNGGEAALGFSQQKATNKKLMTKEEVLCRISVLLGGRCGEKIIYNNVSTGESDDIEKISMLVKSYSTRWGMNNDIGPLNLDAMGVIGENISTDIMDNCKELINNIEKQLFAKQIVAMLSRR